MRTRSYTFTAVLLALTTLLPFAVQAEKSQSFGDYVIHYNAFTTDFLNPAMASAYKVKRSSNRVLLVVTVLKKVMGTTAEPVSAKTRGTASNLTGQLRSLDIREVRDGNAIYYLSTFPVTNEETLDFIIQVTPDGKDAPYTIKFRQQFFTE